MDSFLDEVFICLKMVERFFLLDFQGVMHLRTNTFPFLFFLGIDGIRVSPFFWGAVVIVLISFFEVKNICFFGSIASCLIEKWGKVLRIFNIGILLRWALCFVVDFFESMLMHIGLFISMEKIAR